MLLCFPCALASKQKRITQQRCFARDLFCQSNISDSKLEIGLKCSRIGLPKHNGVDAFCLRESQADKPLGKKEPAYASMNSIQFNSLLHPGWPDAGFGCYNHDGELEKPSIMIAILMTSSLKMFCF